MPKVNAPLLERATAFAPLFVMPTIPVKLFALPSAIAPALPVKVTRPAAAAWVIVPVCEIPKPFKVNVPVPTLTVPNCNNVVSVKLTLLAPLFVKLTTPVKLLALPSANAPALPVKVTSPALAACVIVVTPDCEIPTPLMFNVLLPTFTVPNDNAPVLKRLTAKLPVFASPTAPVKLLLLPSVNTPAPASKFAAAAAAVCVMVVAPDCVIPTPLTDNVPVPTLIVPKLNAPLFVRATLFAPLFVMATIPVRLFALPSAIAPALPVIVARPAPAA